MDTIRSAGSVIATFFIVFLAGLWLLRGAPIPGLAAVTLKPDPAQLTFRERQAELAKQPKPSQDGPQSDGDPVRDGLRQAVIDAADAFVRSPCDAGIKADYVKAALAYARAFQLAAGCTLHTCSGGEARLTRARQAFESPLDRRAKAAMAEAHEAGDLSARDFPEEVAVPVQAMAAARFRLDSWGAPVCGGVARR